MNDLQLRDCCMIGIRAHTDCILHMYKGNITPISVDLRW